MKISIIITTHNRLVALRETIAALERVHIPEAISAELILVENACTDGTAAFIEQARLSNMTCRPFHEAQKGQSRARNLGLSKCRGEIFLFTDDDVRPDFNWVKHVVDRFTTNESDALMGRIVLAPHLDRPWLTRRLRCCLAVSEGLEDGWLTQMIGANMAIHRRVLDHVPRFDEELGPGALGFADDSLFSWQIKEAGLRIDRAPQAVVTHHCAESRLLRVSFLEQARKGGECEAYISHHWRHKRITFPLIRLTYAKMKMKRRELLSLGKRPNPEGCTDWEMSLTHEIAKYKKYLTERHRRRNYAKFGLVRLHREESTIY